MEFNLKNRPMMWMKGKDDFDVLYYMEEWFEGFEKELRYKLEKIREATTRETHSQILLEEILGLKKAGLCPRCGHKMWYSARLKYSKCARCGVRLS